MTFFIFLIFECFTELYRFWQDVPQFQSGSTVINSPFFTRFTESCYATVCSLMFRLLIDALSAWLCQNWGFRPRCTWRSA